MAQSAHKGKMGHNSIGDLVPMNPKIVGSSKLLDTLLNELIHAGNPDRDSCGWQVLSTPIKDKDQLGLMSPAHTLVVQLPGTPAVVGVLKMKAGGHCTLFVRLKHSLLEKWASTNGKDKKERRVFVHSPLSVDGSAMILNAAHAFCMKTGQVHHPQALALLCSMAMGRWLIPPVVGQELPTEFGSLTLIALPPLDTNLEQCLCLLGHKSTFSSPAPVDTGDDDDDDDTPLSSSVVNKHIWGVTHGSVLRNECVAKFREAASIFANHADASTLTKTVPALDKHALEAKRALAAICLLAKKAALDHQNTLKESGVEAKKPAEKKPKKSPEWKAAAAAEVQAKAAEVRKAAAADHARYCERQQKAATKAPKAKGKAKAKAPASDEDEELSDARSNAGSATPGFRVTSKVELVPSDLSEDGLDSDEEGATKPVPKPKPARKRPTATASGSASKRKRAGDSESEGEDNPAHDGSSSEDKDGDDTSSEEDEDDDEDKQGADDASLVATSDEDKASDDDDDMDLPADDDEVEKEQPNKLKVVAPAALSDPMLAAMSDMSGPCCARVMEWQAGWMGASLDPERSTRISKDVELAMNSKTPTALMAAFGSLVTNLVDAHADRFKGESWSVNATDSQRMYALAQQSVAFSTATMERVSTAIDCLEEAREMGRAVLSPFPTIVTKAGAGCDPSASVP